jgi:putative membrane protein
MKPFVLCLAGTLALVSIPVSAQTPQPAPAASPMASVPATAEFVAKASAGNLFEVESSRLALSRTKTEGVKAFATKMVDDHTSASTKLKQILSQAKITAPPEKLDARHQTILDTLKKTDAASFDKGYVDAQYNAHVETIALFKSYAAAGDNAQLKAFAQQMVPTLQSHLDHVAKLR